MCTKNEYISNLKKIEELSGRSDPSDVYDECVPEELTSNDKIKIFNFVNLIKGNTGEYPKVVSFIRTLT